MSNATTYCFNLNGESFTFHPINTGKKKLSGGHGEGFEGYSSRFGKVYIKKISQAKIQQEIQKKPDQPDIALNISNRLHRILGNEALIIQKLSTPELESFVNPILAAGEVNVTNSATGDLVEQTFVLVAPLADGNGSDFHQTHKSNLAAFVHFLASVANCLNAIHQRNVIHLDIKKENIVYFANQNSDRPTFKLIDFGISKNSLEHWDEYAGRAAGLNSHSPEYKQPNLYAKTSKTDCFQLAELALSWLGLKLSDLENQDKARRVNNLSAQLTAKFAKFDNQRGAIAASKLNKAVDNLKQLILDLLNEDPIKRPSALEALERLNIILELLAQQTFALALNKQPQKVITTEQLKDKATFTTQDSTKHAPHIKALTPINLAMLLGTFSMLLITIVVSSNSMQQENKPPQLLALQDKHINSNVICRYAEQLPLNARPSVDGHCKQIEALKQKIAEVNQIKSNKTVFQKQQIKQLEASINQHSIALVKLVNIAKQQNDITISLENF